MGEASPYFMKVSPKLNQISMAVLSHYIKTALFIKWQMGWIIYRFSLMSYCLHSNYVIYYLAYSWCSANYLT